MALDNFHPAVAAWFRRAFAAPTPAQLRAWPAIQSGHHALIAAPTGSGKTLAAFLAAIDGLVRQGIAGELRDETQIVYVSPLKALSNDVRINLEAPLNSIRDELMALGLPMSKSARSCAPAIRRRPSATVCAGSRRIVVTTPESLYILLGSESAAQLATRAR